MVYGVCYDFEKDKFFLNECDPLRLISNAFLVSTKS